MLPCLCIIWVEAMPRVQEPNHPSPVRYFGMEQTKRNIEKAKNLTRSQKLMPSFYFCVTKHSKQLRILQAWLIISIGYSRLTKYKSATILMFQIHSMMVPSWLWKLRQLSDSFWNDMAERWALFTWGPWLGAVGWESYLCTFCHNCRKYI